MAYYDRYRGSRRKRRNRIRIILLILLLLVVAAVVALFYLQETVIFTSDGFHFSFASPKDPQQDDPAEPPDDIHLEIGDPSGSMESLHPGQTAPTTPTAPTEPEPEVLPRTEALLLDGGALLADGSGALEQMDEGGFSQLALRVKSADGLALLDDGLGENGLSPDSPAFLQTLEHLEVPRIAVFSALRDNVRPRTAYRSSAVHTASGANWLDRDYVGWFDPTGKDTLACLTAMVDACEAAGFSQVVLENFQYPSVGKLELIDYGDGQSRQRALTQLAGQLREATDLPLGLVLTEAAATDLLDGTSGQDVAELAQYFDVLYVPATGFAADVSSVAEAISDTDCRVGLLLQQQETVLPADFALDYIIAP